MMRTAPLFEHNFILAGHSSIEHCNRLSSLLPLSVVPFSMCVSGFVLLCSFVLSIP